MTNPQPKRRIIFGGLIILIGVLALLDKLIFFDFSIGSLFQFWPIIFIVFGILKMTESKSRSSIFIGLSFLVVGAGMIFNNLGFFHFTLRDWWPVLLIVIGISVMFKDRSLDSSSTATFTKDARTSTTIGLDINLDISAVIGENKTVNSSSEFKGGKITTIMGSVDVDLRGASIQGEAVLSVWAMWGGIEIKIPSDWEVVNRGKAILGGIEDKSITLPSAGKRLIITGTAIMGAVVIKN